MQQTGTNEERLSVAQKKHKKMKKKALYVGWKESEPNGSDDEEQNEMAKLGMVNICFMAH